jgi:hypothetical protein
MPVYSYLTFGQAKQQVSNRLFDPNQVFWTNTEVGLYLIEALRTWNALTGFWRGDFLFSTTTGTTWYDLTNTTQMPNTLRPLTVLDTNIYTLLQYHLLEPVSWNPWIGNSAQFTADNLLSATQRRRDEILGISGCVTARRTVSAVAGRTVLPDSVIDVRRMAYLPAVGSPSTIWPDDLWSENAFNTGFPNLPAGTPTTYLLSAEPPISFDTDRPPGSAGSYELLTLEAGPALSISTPSTLLIPDDWTHVIKWGVLSSLLSHESNAKDSLRAEYATQRYRMGIAALTKCPALLGLRVGNVTLPIDSVADADHYRATWQSLVPGKPDAAYYAGLNLLALAAQPDSNGGNNYSTQATVVENAPVPASDGDFLQAGRDELSAILDYAQHLAAFKLGGAEFLSTMPLLTRFMQQATTYNSKLKELGEFTTALYQLSQRQESVAPRMASEVSADG